MRVNALRLCKFLSDARIDVNHFNILTSTPACVDEYRYMDVAPQNSSFTQAAYTNLSPADLTVELADSFSLNEVGWFVH